MKRETARLLRERFEAMHEARQAWEDIVVQAWDEGTTLGEIAREAGTNRVSISNLLERRGVRKKARTLGAALAEVDRLERLLREQGTDPDQK